MQILIIEDEPLAAENLELIIKEIEPQAEILYKAQTIRQAVAWLQKNTAELIFCDIQLADGMSFQIFEQVEINTPIIFTTAYDQYAIKAFKLNSIDYLLKPINVTDMAISIKKYKQFSQQQTSNINITALLNTIKGKPTYQNRYMVYVGKKIRSIKTTEIAYFYVREGAVFIATFEGKHFDNDMSLDKIETQLDPDLFFKINRQFIINVNAIESMETVSKSRIKIDLKPKIDLDATVSYNNMQNFKKWLNK